MKSKLFLCSNPECFNRVKLSGKYCSRKCYVDFPPFYYQLCLKFKMEPVLDELILQVYRLFMVFGSWYKVAQYLNINVSSLRSFRRRNDMLSTKVLNQIRKRC